MKISEYIKDLLKLKNKNLLRQVREFIKSGEKEGINEEEYEEYCIIVGVLRKNRKLKVPIVDSYKHYWEKKYRKWAGGFVTTWFFKKKKCDLDSHKKTKKQKNNEK